MHQIHRFAAIFPLGMLLCAPAHSQTMAQPAPAVAPAALTGPKVILAEGTEIKLSLLKDLKSGGQKVDEVIPFEVERDVYSPFPAHVLLIPAGTPAFGHVTKSSRRGFFGKPGNLDFTCDYVVALDGTHVPLRADNAASRGRSNTGTNIAAVLLLEPIFVLVNGRDAVVSKESQFVAYSAGAISLTDPHGYASPAVASPAADAQPVPASSIIAAAPPVRDISLKGK